MKSTTLEKTKHKCTDCKIVKNISDFYKSKSEKQGLDRRCKECSYKRGVDIAYHPNRMYSHYRHGSIKRGIEFSIQKEDFIVILGLSCAYFGQKNEKNGIDRRDNEIGYIKENCISCCKTCNYMKRNLSVKDFLIHCKQITNYNSR